MADYDFSKPAPDRSRRGVSDGGSGAGGLALVIVGVVIVLAVLYAVFGGAVVTDDAGTAPAAIEAPAVDPMLAPEAAPEAAPVIPVE